tara:strand:- start:5001 stop:5750 length:750 start_codon:yes stop_codon:yes gene_type:complete
MALKRVFIWPDTHCPWYNKKAVSCTLKALKAFKPDHLVILGDFLDIHSLSRHDKSPLKTVSFAKEIAVAKELLKRIDKAAGRAKRHFIMGNHENRVYKYLISKAPEIYDMINLPSLLDFERFGFTHFDYLDHLRIGNLILAHDIGHAGKSAHSQSLSMAGMSIAIGHTHRMAMVIEKKLQTGELITGATMGWLGDPDAMKDYMPASKVKRFAITGFGTAYIMNDGTPILVPVPIVNGSCVLEGKLINGR